MIRFLFSVIFFAVLCLAHAEAQEQPRDSLRYIVRMASGDSFRGTLVGYTDSTVSIQTEFGVVIIPKRLIGSFTPIDGPYRKRPLHFLMPTASPNGPGGFLSDYELGFLYGGFGLGYGATVTAGATLIPGLALKSQLFHVGAKFTIDRDESYELALGAAYTYITTDYPYAHIYGVGTFPLGTGRYSVMLLYRAAGREEAPIQFQFMNFDTTRFTLHYTGSLGAAVGFDAPALGRDDMTWVGEVWNNDLTKPQNTVSMLAIRVTNEHLSADFGLAIFSAPAVVPITSFTWRF
ncbi:MAG: hypothetical protein ABIR47_04340 [Candidatus Kapaibacterium sp.]